MAMRHGVIQRKASKRVRALRAALVLWASAAPAGLCGADLVDLDRLEGLGVRVHADAGSEISDVWPVGDVDGDGFADLIIYGRDLDPADPQGSLHKWTVLYFGGSAPSLDLGVRDGRFVEFRRSGDPLLPPPRVVVVAVGRLGDADRDGHADLVIGALETDEKSLILFGGALPPGLDLGDIGRGIRGVALGHSDPVRRPFARGVSDGFDFDGDGRTDVAIGVGVRDEQEPKGEVYVVLDVAGLPADVDLARIGGELPGVVLRGPFHNRVGANGALVMTLFGITAHVLGDIDGDGRDDLLIKESDSPEFYRYYLVRGFDPRGGPTVIDFQGCLNDDCPPGVTVFLGPSQESDRLLLGGASSAGDLDGDGNPEFVVGVFAPPFFRQNPPRYSLFSSDGVTSRIVPMRELPAPGARTTFLPPAGDFGFGSSVDGGVDFNADGIPDILLADGRAGSRGEAYLLFGKRDFPAQVDLGSDYAGLLLRGSFADRLSQARFLGDFNGDGAPDVLVDRAQSIAVLFGSPSGAPPFTLGGAQPLSGPQRGGTVVTIHGTSFAERTRVFFGSRESPSATVTSSGEIRASTPPGLALGPVDILVESAGERRTLVRGFEYAPDFPQYDLAALGPLGSVIEGDLQGAGRTLAWPAVAPLDCGDVTGDHIDDLLASSTATAGWEVVVVHGSRQLPELIPAYERSDVTSQIHAGMLDRGPGATVASAGDVNGDGQGDFVIGCVDRIAYIVFGPLAPREQVSIDELVVARRAVRARMGFGPSLRHVVSTPLGDIDGDGFDDVALAFSGDEGVVVCLAGSNAWPEDADLFDGDLRLHWDLRGTPARQHLGERLASLGDFNGGGRSDLLVAGGVLDDGTARLYLLRGESFPAAAVTIDDLLRSGAAFEIEVPTGRMSFLYVAAAGDTNGDGLGDFLVGAPGDGELVTQGISYLVRGRREWPPNESLRLAAPNASGVTRIFGKGPMQQQGSVGRAGDFNADGLEDFLIGGPGFQNQDEGGSVHLILGAQVPEARIDLGHLGARGLHLQGTNRPGGLGAAVGAAGDFNDDGQPDLVLSEVAGDVTERHRLYIIFGPFTQKAFVRGDANRDGRIDVSDPVFVLQYLFLGGAAPYCADAADADDNGELTLTDAVRLLDFLFRGGPELAPPYPDAGGDPSSDDDLGCLGF